MFGPPYILWDAFDMMFGRMFNVSRIACFMSFALGTRSLDCSSNEGC